MTEELTHHNPEDDVKMTIWEHIGGCRKTSRPCRRRALRRSGRVLELQEPDADWLLIPYTHAWNERFPNLVAKGQGPTLQTLAPADALVNYMQLSLVGGLVLAIPVAFYQLWAFISPGLYSREKRYIIPFVIFSTTLFMGGVAFAYYVALPGELPVLPAQLGLVGSHSNVTLKSEPTIEVLMRLAEHMLLAFGFVFELPLFIGFLALAGIVTPQQLVKFSRYAIIGAFVIGAFITPDPGITGRIAVSSALIGLYFLSVGLAFLIAKKKKDARDESEA